MALRGNIDVANRRLIAGWVCDLDRPDERVSLIIWVDDRIIARGLAECYRPDLAAAGVGDGKHAFQFNLPEQGMPTLARYEIAVRREGDGDHVPGSPRILDPITVFDADLQERLACLLADTNDSTELERRLLFLRDQSRRLSRLCAARRIERVAKSGLSALVIDVSMPNLTRDAGSNAIVSHIRALQRIGYTVAFAPADLAGDATALEAEGVTCCLSPWYDTIEEVLRRNVGAFDLIYLHRESIAASYAQIVRDTQPAGRMIYSVADLHHLRVARQAHVEGRPELAAQAEHLRFLELTAAQQADAVITHSTHEADLLRRQIGPARVHVVPWSLTPRPTAVPFSERRGFAFIGGYGHPPNVDAARWLVEAVMPHLEAASAGIDCKLVGSDMPASLLALRRPHVHPIGHLPDLSVLFDRVRLTVAPLNYGAGVKGKVLDSLSAGVPCVCTPVAVEGLDLPDILLRQVGSTPAELAKLIQTLHSDEELNRACSEAGLIYIAETASEERIDHLLRRALDPANPSGATAR